MNTSTPSKTGGDVIALLGAESTGKTTLAQALAAALVADGRDAVVVGEYLREFCDRERRTPRREEQLQIAAEQQRRIEAAAAAHDVVIADTTALMIAIYSDQVFGDPSLYAAAEAAQRGCRATLVTALDLPWLADGHQRDGAHVREPVDAKLRAALRRAGIDHSVILGSGPARLAAALAVVHRALAPAPIAPSTPRWRWVCERCGDAGCERHSLSTTTRPLRPA
jgi:nicotinamide riboside kinase